MDQKIYGSIPGITDREYYTNSFHIPVYYEISAFDKIRLEAPYHELTNAGHITYVELDGDPLKNLPAFEKIIRAMKETEEGNVKFERIRRITGYLVGTLDNFNDAKKAEVRDRVKHFAGSF